MLQVGSKRGPKRARTRTNRFNPLGKRTFVLIPVLFVFDAPKTAVKLPRSPQDASEELHEGPNTGQDGPRTAPEAPMTAQEAPRRAPRAAQDGPRRPQDCFKTAPEAPKTAPDGPKTAQGAPKTAQEGPKRLPGGRKTAHEGSKRPPGHRKEAPRGSQECSPSGFGNAPGRASPEPSRRAPHSVRERVGGAALLRGCEREGAKVLGHRTARRREVSGWPWFAFACSREAAQLMNAVGFTTAQDASKLPQDVPRGLQDAPRGS